MAGVGVRLGGTKLLRVEASESSCKHDTAPQIQAVVENEDGDDRANGSKGSSEDDVEYDYDDGGGGGGGGDNGGGNDDEDNDNNDNDETGDVDRDTHLYKDVLWYLYEDVLYDESMFLEI
ncbi:prostatic spermine-binding protein-like [Pogonomyrmex barbatus]|uniref:Prostatic spermine-binding protein-like n=1 Tax=Pogonomyrmex barbatus TaxID=144034 RepID=A0A6I9WRF1_9HYME|nr:prostatic spermine-binding protein-like [Pogonomyrmex barbatus]